MLVGQSVDDDVTFLNHMSVLHSPTVPSMNCSQVVHSCIECWSSMCSMRSLSIHSLSNQCIHYKLRLKIYVLVYSIL